MGLARIRDAFVWRVIVRLMFSLINAFIIYHKSIVPCMYMLNAPVPGLGLMEIYESTLGNEMVSCMFGSPEDNENDSGHFN